MMSLLSKLSLRSSAKTLFNFKVEASSTPVVLGAFFVATEDARKRLCSSSWFLRKRVQKRPSAIGITLSLYFDGVSGC